MSGKMSRAGLGVYVFLALSTIDGSSHAQSKSILPVKVEIPFVTSPVRGNGEYNLVYEIHLTNFWKKDLRLERIEAFAEGGRSPIAKIAGEKLAGILYKPRHPTDLSDARVLECGRTVIAFIWLTSDTMQEFQNRIFHRLSFAVIGSDSKSERFVDGGLISVPKENPVSLHPPFRKGNWLIGSGPSNRSEHRRAVLTVDGSTWLLQRFAFDVMKFGADGRVVRGETSRNENWISYGEEVLAVADGIVSLVIDGIPENQPLSPQRAVPMNRDTHVGNCVILDIGNEHFALYAHLKSGSIPVKTGDKVKQGKVIGRIGNSGNSEASHLHFSIGNRSDPYSAEGLPYVFESFEVLDVSLPKDDELLIHGINAQKLKTAKKSKIRNEMPVGDVLLHIQ
jgi:hypothetical protein